MAPARGCVFAKATKKIKYFGSNQYNQKISFFFSQPLHTPNTRDEMSVLLLHNTEELAAKLRDDEHMLADGAGHVLVDRAALTVDLMSVLLLGARPRANVARTEHELGEGLRLRITHDARVMGPPGLRNLGPGLHAAPWGVWLVFRGKDISDCGHIDDGEIEDILESEASGSCAATRIPSPKDRASGAAEKAGAVQVCVFARRFAFRTIAAVPTMPSGAALVAVYGFRFASSPFGFCVCPGCLGSPWRFCAPL